MPSPCPRCGEEMTASTVRTTFWHDDRPAIVEDIPALVCGTCMEQFYDEDVSDAERDAAWKRILSAAKKFGVDVHEKSWRELPKHAKKR